jgi:DNA-binding SARP family transcriptional activator
VRDLFCYLLLHRNQHHSREVLAGLLWSEMPTAQSKKCLRQALWHLQSALSQASTDEPALLVDPEWIQINTKAHWWVDVVTFEQAWNGAQDVRGEDLDPPTVEALQQAVDLYRGDLLEGSYEDWCVYKRERLQHLYLAILRKLMASCEAHREYEAGICYGMRILGYDRACERAHRRLMRLHYLAGDRAAALRQYEHCVTALDEELGVMPDKRTLALYEQLRSDQSCGETFVPSQPALAADTTTALLADVLGRLQQLQVAQVVLQQEVQLTMRTLEQALSNQPAHCDELAGLERIEPLFAPTPELRHSLVRPLERTARAVSAT